MGSYEREPRAVGVLPARPLQNPAQESGQYPVVLSVVKSSARRSLQFALERDPRFLILHCSSAANDLVAYCRYAQPCILLVDYPIWDALSAECEEPALDLGRALHLVVRLPAEDPQLTEALIRAGCAGVLHERDSPAIVRKGLLAVAAGEIWAPRKLVSALLRATLFSSRCQLTQREAAILREIQEGRTNNEIAQRLFISPQTVRWHLRSIYRKLGTHERARLGHP